VSLSINANGDGRGQGNINPPEGIPLPRVLIVDDESCIRALLDRVLRRHFVVFTAPNPDSALEILNQEHIDAVLTDIHMPDGDGVDLAQNIAFRFPQLPIAFMTALHDEYTLDRVEATPYPVVFKPFNLAALASFLQDLVFPVAVQVAAA